MKNFLIIIVLLLLENSAFSQTWFIKPINDRIEMHLKGKVKSISESQYQVINMNGVITNGPKNYIRTYIFDLIGKKIKSVSSTQYEKEIKIYKYGMKGNKIEEDYYDLNNNFLGKQIYKYDDNGKMISDSDEDTYLYSKDDNGINQVQRVQNNGYKTTFKYDINGNLLATINYDTDGNLSEQSTSAYDKYGNKIEDDSYNVRSAIIYEKDIFKYDIKRNKVQWIKYNQGGDIGGQGYYKYDNKGNEVEFKWYNSDGSLRYTSTSNYEYDKNLNWIKRYEYHDGVPSLYTERQILYY